MFFLLKSLTLKLRILKKVVGDKQSLSRLSCVHEYMYIIGTIESQQ